MGVIDETVQAEGLQIFIGSENNLFGLTGCSTIISPFKNKKKEYSRRDRCYWTNEN